MSPDWLVPALVALGCAVIVLAALIGESVR